MGWKRGRFTVPEKQLLRTATNGELLDLNGSNSYPIRASVVKSMATEGKRGHQPPLEITGARVTGVLDLESAHLARALDIRMPPRPRLYRPNLNTHASPRTQQRIINTQRPVMIALNHPKHRHPSQTTIRRDKHPKS
jgi:hypothetical protein